MIHLHEEDVGSAGNWNSFAYLKKLQEFQSAWIDYAKITFIVDDIDGGSSTQSAATRGSNVAGFMFACNNSTNNPGTIPENTISVAAHAASGGSVSLPIKRRIVDNDVDQTRNDGRLYLWIKGTDFTYDDDVKVRMFVEVYGRWHDVVTQ